MIVTELVYWNDEFRNVTLCNGATVTLDAVSDSYGDWNIVARIAEPYVYVAPKRNIWEDIYEDIPF